jgi:hypothetical protein
MGYLFSKNIFTNNFGCSQKAGGAIRFECVNSAQTMITNNDRYSISSITSATGTNYLGVNLALYTTSTQTATYLTHSYTADMNKLIFEYNTYTENFYTGGKALIHLEGAPRVYITDDKFTNNGDNCKEALNLYGSGIMSGATNEMTIQTALSNLGAYSSTTLGQSLYAIKRSVQVSLNNMYFDNNW